MANNQIVRLKRRSEFISVTKEGRRFHVNDWLMINWSNNESAEIKVGWTIPGYVGTAVVRNRLKRWLKEYLDKKWRRNSEGMVVHFLFKKRPAGFYKALSHEELDAAVELGLKNVARRARQKK